MTTVCCYDIAWEKLHASSYEESWLITKLTNMVSQTSSGIGSTVLFAKLFCISNYWLQALGQVLLILYLSLIIMIMSWYTCIHHDTRTPWYTSIYDTCIIMIHIMILVVMHIHEEILIMIYIVRDPWYLYNYHNTHPWHDTHQEREERECCVPCEMVIAIYIANSRMNGSHDCH